jgi:long-subunit fatty acid transport protein
MWALSRLAQEILVKTFVTWRFDLTFSWLPSFVRLCATVTPAVLATCLAASAEAAGIEDTVTGGYTLGRAAGVGSVNDFMAIWQNPANLAVVPGASLGSELRLPIYRACFDRAFNPDAKYRLPAEDFKGDEYFGNICNTGPLIPTGAGGLAMSYDNGFGWGVGVFAPAGIGALNFGHSTNVTVSPAEMETFPITTSGVEYPTRQMLIRRRQIGAWLTAGLGWQPTPKFRVGASFGYGIVWIDNTNMASTLGGSFRDAQVVNRVRATDWFIPRAMVSAVVTPVDSFELFAALTYQGDVNAKGHSDLTANGIKGAPLTNCLEENPGPHCRVNDAKLDVPFPSFEGTFGFRYAERRHKRVRVLDPMKDERWDFSVEATWAQTSHVKDFTATFADPNDEVAPRVSLTTDPERVAPFIPRKAVIPHRWKDTWGVRAGGDINLVPEAVSMRLGLSYSSNAIEPGYMNIDSYAVQKFGLHAGISLQSGNKKLTFGYAHIFYKDTNVPVGSGRVKEIASQLAGQANAVNEGFYQASLDVISLQSNISF